MATYSTTVKDTYDFAYQDYKSILVSLVNNAAWLSQHVNALHKIKISISFVTK